MEGRWADSKIQQDPESPSPSGASTRYDADTSAREEGASRLRYLSLELAAQWMALGVCLWGLGVSLGVPLGVPLGLSLDVCLFVCVCAFVHLRASAFMRLCVCVCFLQFYVSCSPDH